MASSFNGEVARLAERRSAPEAARSLVVEYDWIANRWIQWDRRVGLKCRTELNRRLLANERNVWKSTFNSYIYICLYLFIYIYKCVFILFFYPVYLISSSVLRSNSISKSKLTIPFNGEVVRLAERRSALEAARSLVVECDWILDRRIQWSRRIGLQRRTELVRRLIINKNIRACILLFIHMSIAVHTYLTMCIYIIRLARISYIPFNLTI